MQSLHTQQAHLEDQERNIQHSSEQDKDLKELVQEPESPQRNKHIDAHLSEQEKLFFEDYKKVEAIATESPLGIILGFNAWLMNGSRSSYIYFRLLKEKIEKETTERKDIINAHKTVGGFLQRIKATRVKVEDFANKFPQGAVRIMNKVVSVDEKINSLITLHPLKRHIHDLRRQLTKIEAAQTHITDTQTKAAHILSEGHKQKIRALHSAENYMLQDHLKQERDVYGKEIFQNVAIQLDVQKRELLVKDRNSSSLKRVPYEYDQRGYLVFDGQISLHNAIKQAKSIEKNTTPEEQSKESSTPDSKHTEIDAKSADTEEKKTHEQTKEEPATTEATPKQEETTNTSPEQIKTPLVLSLEERSSLVTFFERDKKHTFFIDREKNSAFFDGTADTLTITNGQDPTESLTIQLSLQNAPYGKQLLYASYPNNPSVAPFHLLSQAPSGKKEWAESPYVSTMLETFKVVPILPEDIQTVEDTIKQQSPAAVVEEHVLNKGGWSWSTAPNLFTITTQEKGNSKEYIINKDTTGTLSLIESHKKNEQEVFKKIPLKQFASSTSSLAA